MFASFTKMFQLKNAATSRMRTLDSPLGTSPLMFNDVSEGHLHTTTKLQELALVPWELLDQLPGECVGDGLVGRRVGHPARGAGRHPLPACPAHDVARGAGGDRQLPRDGEADGALEVFSLNACPNRGHGWGHLSSQAKLN